MKSLIGRLAEVVHRAVEFGHCCGLFVHACVGSVDARGKAVNAFADACNRIVYLAGGDSAAVAGCFLLRRHGRISITDSGYHHKEWCQ